jgi:hypothetical protein
VKASLTGTGSRTGTAAATGAGTPLLVAGLRRRGRRDGGVLELVIGSQAAVWLTL